MQQISSLDVTVTCPGCARESRAAAEWMFRTVECPGCSHTFEIRSISPPAGPNQHIDSVKLIEQDEAAAQATIVTPAPFDTGTDPAQSARVLNASVVSKKTVQRRLGRYVLKGTLGEGGFGSVYLADDPELGREVAIKIPRLTFLKIKGLDDKESAALAAKRFLKEARSAAKLRHPNIVAVFDHGQTDNGVYIVYEFVPGQTLDRCIADKSVVGHAALEIIATIADALAYAASEGIVHRDIKPANIMIDKRGRPQIMDFGLAELLDDGKANTGGSIMGTPAYMSPEQARGAESIDAASDQYALGAILYEWVTGTRAVLASGHAAIAEVARRPHPPLEPLQPLDRDLRSIILRTMAAAPQDRYASCHDLAADLRAYMAKMPVQANPIGPLGRLVKWTRRNRATAVALFTVAILLVVVAGVSSIAAIMLQQSGRDLRSALYTANQASELAKQSAEEAERQKRHAETQATLAITNQKTAESERQRAEDALSDVLAEQQKRALAEQMASAAREKEQAAIDAASSAQDALQSIAKRNDSLQYYDLLLEATASLSRQDTSNAITLLNRCDPEQRGWEWNFLVQWSRVRPSLQQATQTPAAVMEMLSYPALLKPNGYQVYDTCLIESKANPTGRGRPRVNIAPDGKSGLLIQNRTGIQFLTRLNFESGTFLDLRGELTPRLPQVHAAGKFVSVKTLPFANYSSSTSSSKDPIVTYLEVWETDKPRAVLKKTVEAGWAAPVAILADRRIVVATNPTQLDFHAIDNGNIVANVETPSPIANGANTLQQLPDGRVAVLLADNRIHCINPATLEQSTSEPWEQAAQVEEPANPKVTYMNTVRDAFKKEELPDALGRCWDDTGRYVAVHTKQSFEIDLSKVAAPEAVTAGRKWKLIDVANAQVIAALDSPISPAKRVKAFEVDKERQNRFRTEMLYQRELAIDALYVGENASVVAIRDDDGGIRCWNAPQIPGQTEGQLNVMKSIRSHSVSATSALFTDGEFIAAFDALALSGRPTVTRRPRGPSLKKIIASQDGKTVACFDENNRLTILSNGDQTAQLPLEPVEVGVFTSSDRMLVLGTSQGTLITVDCQSGAIVRSKEAHLGPVTALIPLSDPPRLVTGGDDRRLRLWDVETGSEIEIAPTFLPEPVSALAYDPKQKRLAATCGSMLYLFECERWDRLENPISATNPHGGTHVRFSADGSRILVGNKSTLSLARASDAKIIYTFPKLRIPIATCSFSSDGPFVIFDDASFITWSVK